MLLSKMEIGQICHEQNHAYAMLLGLRVTVPWDELEVEVQQAIEKKVAQIMRGETTEKYVQHPNNNVQKIMEGLFKSMVEVLMNL